MASLINIVSSWFTKPLAEQGVDIESVRTDQEEELDFLIRYDNYLGFTPTQKEDLYFNIAYTHGYCWIPTDHPISWALKQTHRGNGVEHELRTPKCGSCVIYEESYVGNAVDDIHELYVRHNRMKGPE